ncbi:MAG: YkgJ family cysteine cluster protein [Nitrospirota bacterium]|nr:YkgJ family cysteine cluster protein [Nitrospirota bacterium]
MTALPDGPSRLMARCDQWFERARASVLGNLPCRRGCSRCCIGPFAITRLDVAVLRQGLDALDLSLRQDIESSARSQVAAFEAAFPRLTEGIALDRWSDGEVDRLVERFRNLPCPALAEDGSCRVYPFRPVTCRTMGIPVEADGLVAGACEVQTAVPVQRIPLALRQEEQRLVEQEQAELAACLGAAAGRGEEMLLPYGFLPDRGLPLR